MTKATIIFGGDAIRYYNETGQIPSAEWLMDNGGAVQDIEFSTKAEYNAYVQGVSDAHLWGDYHILPKTDAIPQPESAVWMRLGATVHGDKDDIEKIIHWYCATLNKLLENKSLDIIFRYQSSKNITKKIRPTSTKRILIFQLLTYHNKL